MADAKPWLTIVGLGEDGPEGLSAASLAALQEAEVIMGAKRHLGLLPDVTAELVEWPVPFADGLAILNGFKGRQTVALASGDPFWHGAGGSLMRDLDAEEWISHPAPSCFALAANRLGWKLEEVLCLGLHAAPYARLHPLLGRGVRVICTLRDRNAPAELAAWLTENGQPDARLCVMERLGGAKEQLHRTTAETWDLPPGGAPVLMAIEAMRPGLPRASGLADTHFASDGQITKRPVRALTLSALAPRAGELLWDIGGGSGSISVEWCLAAPGTRAITFEPRESRLENIRANAACFGLDHRMKPVLGKAPEVLDGFELPDCVFIGGGGSQALLDHLWQILSEGTRLVANGVTLETETLLMRAHAERGGHLLKAEIAEAGPLGTMRGWERARPVIQWSVTR